jgi:hypothetical protein
MLVKAVPLAFVGLNGEFLRNRAVARELAHAVDLGGPLPLDLKIGIWKH